MPARSKSNTKSKSPLNKSRSAAKDYSFFEDVYDVVRQIPKGRVTSYGAIANYLGSKMSARMVGWAMNGAHDVAPSVPAHRVVNRAGLLTGKLHFKDENEMERLLKKEKITVENNQVQNFQKLFWDPSTDLSL